MSSRDMRLGIGRRQLNCPMVEGDREGDRETLVFIFGSLKCGWWFDTSSSGSSAWSVPILDYPNFGAVTSLAARLITQLAARLL